MASASVQAAQALAGLDSLDSQSAAAPTFVLELDELSDSDIDFDDHYDLGEDGDHDQDGTGGLAMRFEDAKPANGPSYSSPSPGPALIPTSSSQHQPQPRSSSRYAELEGVEGILGKGLMQDTRTGSSEIAELPPIDLLGLECNLTNGPLGPISERLDDNDNQHVPPSSDFSIPHDIELDAVVPEPARPQQSTHPRTQSQLDHPRSARDETTQSFECVGTAGVDVAHIGVNETDACWRETGACDYDFLGDFDFDCSVDVLDNFNFDHMESSLLPSADLAASQQNRLHGLSLERLNFQGLDGNEAQGIPLLPVDEVSYEPQPDSGVPEPARSEVVPDPQLRSRSPILKPISASPRLPVVVVSSNSLLVESGHRQGSPDSCPSSAGPLEPDTASYVSFEPIPLEGLKLEKQKKKKKNKTIRTKVHSELETDKINLESHVPEPLDPDHTEAPNPVRRQASAISEDVSHLRLTSLNSEVTDSSQEYPSVGAGHDWDAPESGTARLPSPRKLDRALPPGLPISWSSRSKDSKKPLGDEDDLGKYVRSPADMIMWSGSRDEVRSYDEVDSSTYAHDTAKIKHSQVLFERLANSPSTDDEVYFPTSRRSAGQYFACAVTGTEGEANIKKDEKEVSKLERPYSNRPLCEDELESDLASLPSKKKKASKKGKKAKKQGEETEVSRECHQQSSADGTVPSQYIPLVTDDLEQTGDEVDRFLARIEKEMKTYGRIVSQDLRDMTREMAKERESMGYSVEGVDDSSSTTSRHETAETLAVRPPSRPDPWQHLKKKTSSVSPPPWAVPPPELSLPPILSSKPLSPPPPPSLQPGARVHSGLACPFDSGRTNLQAGDESGARSYLSVVCSTIQIVQPGRVLLVWHTNFHPGFDRRFQKASIVCKFLKPATTTPAPAPDLPLVPKIRAPSLPSSSSMPHRAASVLMHAPRRAYGGYTREQRRLHWGVELPLSVNAGPASVGVKPHVSAAVAKEVDHSFTITGTARGVPLKTNCVWTVEENGSSKRGIPSEIRFATLLDYEGPFVCEVDVAARTAGLFPRWLKTKAPPEQRRAPIDPASFAGSALSQYDIGGDDDGGLHRMFNSWTGEVEGAILPFAQAVVSV